MFNETKKRYMMRGTKLRITKIQDTEDIKRNCAGWHYQNRVGVVERVGEDGLIYGSWGKLGVNPAIDEFDIIDYPDETVDSFIAAQKLKDKRLDDDYWDWDEETENRLQDRIEEGDYDDSIWYYLPLSKERWRIWPSNDGFLRYWKNAVVHIEKPDWCKLDYA